MVFFMSFLDTIKILRVGVSGLSKQDRPRLDCYQSLIGVYNVAIQSVSFGC